MKRFLILAAGSLSAAGAALGAAGVITAAPAVAAPGCVPDFACDIADQPNTFRTSIQDSFGSFTSIVTGQQAIEQATQFVAGPCDTDVNSNDCGLVNQPGRFVENLASQPGQFVESINPATNLQTFADSILSGPSTFVDSITSPFGEDDSAASGAPGDEE